MVQQSIGSKMKKVDSASFASGLVDDELGEKQNVDDVSDDETFQENSMVYEIAINKTDSGASSSKPGLIGSESGEISKALNCEGGKDFQENSIVHEIAGDEIHLVPSLSKSGLRSCESGETSKALNFESDKEPDRAQANIGGKENAAASFINTKNMCDRIVNSRKGDISSRDSTGDKATCVKEKDLCNDVIVPVDNPSLKRKYRELTEQNDKKSVDSVDKHSSTKKKFNIYTGHSCDFARKFLADMVKNGAFRDK